MPLTSTIFAHMTDVHLPIPARPAISQLLNKRALGYLSWRRKRCKRHKRWVADALAQDLTGRQCRTALISGDLVNIALPAEFLSARSWLDDKLAHLSVVFTPGNHETYIRTDWSETLGQLAPYMIGRHGEEAEARPTANAADFPFTIPLDGFDDAHVIVANSSPPTAPGMASGALGAGQIQRIRAALVRAGDQGKFRILMLHHPVNDGIVAWRKALHDRSALRKVIAEAGVELVLHGHAHRPSRGVVETPAGAAPVFGGGAASHPEAHGLYRPARYNRFTLSRAPGEAWRLDWEARELDPETKTFSTVERETFAYPA